MSRIIDNLIAYRILSMLVTPFTDTTAFKLNIIDASGKNLKKASTLKTSEERDAYSYLHRLVFNMKKILLKLPGGDSKIKNLIANKKLPFPLKTQSVAFFGDKKVFLAYSDKIFNSPENACYETILSKGLSISVTYGSQNANYSLIIANKDQFSDFFGTTEFRGSLELVLFLNPFSQSRFYCNEEFVDGKFEFCSGEHL